MPFHIVFRVVRHPSAIILHLSRRIAAMRTARLTGLRLPAPLAALLLILAAAAPMRAQTFVQQSPAASPPARLGASMAYDAATGQVVLFSGWGTGGSTLLSDTWVWNGINWTEESPATSPAARGYASMVYDAALGQVVLFGGVGNTAPGSNGFFNDTWVWNGTNWTQESPATSPSGRDYAAMAYYAPGNLVVLFAGDNSTGVLDDTWTWDGTNWTLRTPATSPPARLAASMVYDAVEGQVVLFGGDGDGGVRLADTWVLDGNGWTMENPATSPSGRGSSAMAYDSLQGQVVLFGGANNGGLLADTWVWNGTNWTQESTAANPSARWASAMAYDAAQGDVLLVGGSDSTSSPFDALGDTWLYSQDDFGSVSIGTTSAAQTFNFAIPSGTTVGSIGVLTQGAPNLDFADAGGDTCTATTYASTTNCTVNVQFAPKYAGLRMGAVVFKDGSGNVLSTTYIHGIGTGPQIAFAPAAITTVGGGFNAPSGVAVDASGNIYVADEIYNLVGEMPPGCASSSCVTSLGGGQKDPSDV
ncbi:MAG: kelch repeat-containing protein, partial [Terracidiphilus sp.]